MKAISPVIATVIIVAVVIAISVGVALWLTGTVQSIMGGTEQLQIMPDSNITGTKIHLHLKNKGTSDIKIIAIRIQNKPININKTTIKAGSDEWITADVPSGVDITPGNYYQVVVITDKGNTYTQTILAYSGS